MLTKEITSNEKNIIKQFVVVLKPCKPIGEKAKNLTNKPKTAMRSNRANDQIREVICQISLQ